MRTNFGYRLMTCISCVGACVRVCVCVCVCVCKLKDKKGKHSRMTATKKIAILLLRFFLLPIGKVFHIHAIQAHGGLEV